MNLFQLFYDYLSILRRKFVNLIKMKIFFHFKIWSLYCVSVNTLFIIYHWIYLRPKKTLDLFNSNWNFCRMCKIFCWNWKNKCWKGCLLLLLFPFISVFILLLPIVHFIQLKLIMKSLFFMHLCYCRWSWSWFILKLFLLLYNSRTLFVN